MAYNKVEYAGNVLVDLTGDTVTSDTLFDGQTAHDKSGEEIVGTFSLEPEITEQEVLIEQIKTTLSGKAAATPDLNFAVVDGTTQPTSPTVNMIWVDTDTAITDWMFSPIQPTSKSDGTPLSGGEVWFNVSTSCPTPINTLKKNGLWVYPTACQQYVGGAWVAKEAKTYQNDVWVPWRMYLYNKGDECAGLTGGWQGRALPGKSSSTTLISGAVAPTITRKANSMSVKIPGSSKNGIVEVIKDVDLRPFTTLKANIIAYTNTNNSITPRLGIMPRNAAYWNEDFIGQVSFASLDGGVGVLSLDLSALNLTAEGYDVYFCGATSSGTAAITFEFDEVWAE